MRNIYTVNFQDIYNDEHSDSIVAIWLDKETAVDYATRYHLEHEETITVEKREEGGQHFFKVETIYERQHYDHTQALFSKVYLYAYTYLTQKELVAVCVEQASPLITQEVDFDRLYRLHKEGCTDDEED